MMLLSEGFSCKYTKTSQFKDRNRGHWLPELKRVALTWLKQCEPVKLSVLCKDWEWRGTIPTLKLKVLSLEKKEDKKQRTHKTLADIHYKWVDDFDYISALPQTKGDIYFTKLNHRPQSSWTSGLRLNQGCLHQSLYNPFDADFIIRLDSSRVEPRASINFQYSQLIQERIWVSVHWTQVLKS